MGRAYLALVFGELPVDLFIVHPPAEWGVIFALRTGPGDWNVRLVIACPEEADFFRALGQAWVEPWERRPECVRIDPRLLAEASAPAPVVPVQDHDHDRDPGDDGDLADRIESREP